MGIPSWIQLRTRRIKLWLKRVKNDSTHLLISAGRNFKSFITSYSSLVPLNMCGIFVTESSQKLKKWQILWSVISASIVLYESVRLGCLVVISAKSETHIWLHNFF